ncbi:MAG: four helix bundle protein [Candidatus Pacebacteria bacterium]|nr:four helix bundle protein [Candidatus Paceibacterota bacterium]
MIKKKTVTKKSITLKSDEDKIVWQESCELVKLVYKVTAQLPKSESFALNAQIHRSSVAIVSNLADASTKKKKEEYFTSIHTAYDLALKLQTQLSLCVDLYKIDTSESSTLLTKINKMLRAIINKLEPKKK